MNISEIIKKPVVIVAVVAIIILGAIVLLNNSKSNEEIKDLFELSEQKNMAIAVEYTTEAPTVAFIAPDGTRYDEKQIENGNMIFEHWEEDKKLVYMIPDAMEGKWSIAYNKGTNSELNITYMRYEDGIKYF